MTTSEMDTIADKVTAKLFDRLASHYVTKDTCEATHKGLPVVKIWTALGGLAVIQTVVILAGVAYFTNGLT